MSSHRKYIGEVSCRVMDYYTAVRINGLDIQTVLWIVIKSIRLSK